MISINLFQVKSHYLKKMIFYFSKNYIKMRKSIIVLFAVICLVTSVTSANTIKRRRTEYYKYYTNKCNNYALEKTKLKDIYECVNSATKIYQCNHLENFETFNNYRNECYRKIDSNKASIDVIVFLSLWIVFVILNF